MNISDAFYLECVSAVRSIPYAANDHYSADKYRIDFLPQSEMHYTAPFAKH